jgi:REP element-mobilizing transposase RayT
MHIMEQQSARFGCDLLVHVFMPDHAHILLAGREETSDTLSAIRAFKHQTGYWLSQHNPQYAWQKDYYDHILRTWERGDEEIQKHIRYILCNPVRKGLVAKWQDYPYKGSTVYQLDEWE